MRHAMNVRTGDAKPEVRFDDRVAIVTGAGAGMGRSYAHELARRGACVLVNDSGTDPRGSGASSAPAERVVDEIRSRGGQAVANTVSVGSADNARAIAAAALDAFGRIDILINNAGISSAGAFSAHTDESIERGVAVNFLGPFHLLRAVWPTMQSQAYGRILNVSSSAAFGGGENAPYAASKAGLIGLTLATAGEGAGYGVQVNAVLPSAYSRMIELAPDPDFAAWFRAHLPAEKAVAAVLFFLSEPCDVTGCIFTAGGGRLARIGFVESEGFFETDLTPEVVRDRIGEAMSLDGPVMRIDRGPDLLKPYAERFSWPGSGGPEPRARTGGDDT